MKMFKKLFDLQTGYIHINNIKSLSKSTFIESFDENKLTFILNNKDKIQFRNENTKNLSILDNYLKYSNDGSIDVKYNKIDNELHGRYYANGSLSGQGMIREIRYTIFNDYYTDIDIVNCHPIIIRWLCNNLSIKYNYLNQYIVNREDIFKELIDLNTGSDKDMFKRAILSINNGGTKDYDNIKNKSNFIIKYNDELKIIREQICDKLFKFKEKTKQNILKKNPDDSLYNLNGKTIANICCFVENQLLLIILDYFKKKVDKEIYQQSILCFDGLMIRSNISDIDIHIIEIEKLFAKMDIDVNISIKSMIPIDLAKMGYDDSIKYELPKKNDEFELVEDYVEHKNYFDFEDKYFWSDFVNDLNKIDFKDDETACAYLKKNLPKVCQFVHDSIFLKKDDESFYDIRSKKTFIGLTMIHVHKPFGKGTRLTHIDLSRYVLDNFRNFNLFNKISSNFTHPRNQKEFDLSLDFAAKIVDIDDKAQSLIDEFKNYMKEIFCSDDHDQFEYLWKWFAFTVKYPHLKTKVGILAISLPGTGKGTFVDFMCNYVYGTYNTLPNITGIDKLVGEKNIHLLGKKLIHLNELPSNKSDFMGNADKLKAIITENNIMIRPLFCNAFNATQTCELILSSNHINSLVIEENDRRWFVIDINNKYLNNKEFFGNFQDKFYNQDMGDYIYTDLMNQDFTASEFYKLYIPKTIKKQTLKDVSKRNSLVFVDDLIEDKLNEHSLNLDELTEDDKKRFFRFHTKYMYDKYLEWCSANNEKSTKKSLFKELLIEYKFKIVKSSGNNYYQME